MLRPGLFFISLAIGALVGFAFVAIASSQTVLAPPPPDLYANLERIALTTEQTPASAAATATYATAGDTARVAVRVIAAESPLIEWGRITTVDSVDNAALGLVPAWRAPAGFDWEAFAETTGCADARLVATDTPRADIDTGELGYTQDWHLPAADHPIAAAFALCLTPDGQILHLLNVHLTAEQPAAPTVELMTGAVAWLASVPGEGEDTPAATCEAGDGEFRVQIIERGDC